MKHVFTKSTLIAAALYTAAGLFVSANAAERWRFTVHESQAGYGGSCDAPLDIPCSVMPEHAPNLLANLTISGNIVYYIVETVGQTPDDNNTLISFVPNPALGLLLLNFPPPFPQLPQLVNFSLNATNGHLSGTIYIDNDAPFFETLSMHGFNDTWVGWWAERNGEVHQFIARSTKEKN